MVLSMFKKILFPTDDSPSSKNALNYVAELALKHESEVIVLHTYYMIKRFNAKPTSYYSYLNKAEENMINQGNEILESTKKFLEEKNIKVQTVLEKGNIGSVIVSKIETYNCDVVVMGSRGLGNLTSMLISSASNYVIHHTKCPVLLVY